jgi:mRNA-degrading endonuclease toxin of MazEF toxin-antitoxin module
MGSYYPQGAFVVLDHDPYGRRSSRPAFILSDDKHPDRFDPHLEDPSYTAALCTTGFFTSNAWSLPVKYNDLDEGKTFARKNSYIMLWAVRPIYTSEITKRISQATDEFLKDVGEAYNRFLNPAVNSL